MRRVELRSFWKQGLQVAPDGFEQRRWHGRHGSPTVTERRNSVNVKDRAGLFPALEQEAHVSAYCRSL
jgi:hypothetical protein